MEYGRYVQYNKSTIFLIQLKCSVCSIYIYMYSGLLVAGHLVQLRLYLLEVDRYINKEKAKDIKKRCRKLG